MHQPCAEDEVGAHQEGVWQLDGVGEGEQADAHGDADVAVADLRADDDIRAAFMCVVEGNEGIGQDHEEAAEPADLG